ARAAGCGQVKGGAEWKTLCVWLPHEPAGDLQRSHTRSEARIPQRREASAPPDAPRQRRLRGVAPSILGDSRILADAWIDSDSSIRRLMNPSPRGLARHQGWV